MDFFCIFATRETLNAYNDFMKLASADVERFKILMTTVNAGVRHSLLQELKIPEQELYAAGLSLRSVEAAHGHKYDVFKADQDNDGLLDARDKNPFEADSNHDHLKDGVDLRLAGSRDVDRDGKLNGSDKRPFVPDIE